MAGVARGVVDVASNAGHYGMANGGTGDKTALLALMFRLEMTRMESGIPTTGMEPGILIKLCNQARWGTRQAVVRLDVPAFEADVDVAKAGHYGEADGGASDKMALVALMFRLDMTRTESISEHRNRVGNSIQTLQ